MVSMCVVAYAVFAFPYNVIPTWYTTESVITTDFVAFDYDNDGDLDIAFCNYKSDGLGYVTLYRNSNGYLAGPVWRSSWNGGAYRITAGDYNNDGYLDLAVGAVSILPLDGNTVLFQNNGNAFPAFSPSPVWTSSDAGDASSMQFADIDNDGWLELIVDNTDGRLRVYDNSASGMSEASIDPFRSSEGAYQVRGFALSNYNNNDISNMNTQLVCGWGYRLKAYYYSDSSQLLGNFNPYYASWIGDVRQTGLNYIVHDLNEDNRLDWISYELNRLYRGLSDTYSLPFSFQVAEMTVEGINETIVQDIAITSFMQNSSINTYFGFGCSGVLDMTTMMPVYQESYDRIYIYNNTNNSLELIWTSRVRVPSLAIGFYDLDERPEDVICRTLQYNVGIPNQTFYLPICIQRVNNVMLNGIQLSRYQYHIDICNSYVSLIGGNCGDVLVVNCTSSIGSEMIVATNERNHIYYYGQSN